VDNRYQPVIWMQAKGAKAYLVGNQSRSRLLGNLDDPHDIDIATSALPYQVSAILQRQKIIPTQVNRSFGVVAFKWQGGEYEVTTFRQDIYDAEFDHIKRAPRKIIFTEDLELDAKRRDFTINAIYFNPKTGKFNDPVGGVVDLKNKVLRFIGDSELRIKEDPIRVLRAVRFKCNLGLKYAPETARALRKWGHLVHRLSSTSLKREFQKINALPDQTMARQELQRFGVVPRH
jgi:tRNA nucleotidyltransferase/poly(A) polymerase